MNKTFINITLNGSIRVWSINRFDNSNVTVIQLNYLGSSNIQTLDVIENNVAYLRRIKDKLKDGYVEVNLLPGDAETAKTFIRANSSNHGVKEAMKCQKYDPSKFDYPCFGEPKINGIRCYIVWGTYVTGKGVFETTDEGVILYSMGGKRYNIPRIAAQFTKEDFISDKDNDIADLYYDGELYVHGETVNVIKKRIPIEVGDAGAFSNSSLSSLPVKFYCFDMAIEDTIYENRRRIRYNKLALITTDSYLVVNKITPRPTYEMLHVVRVSPIVHVSDTIILNSKEAEAYTDVCIKHGFEGSVLRAKTNIYKYGKRPKDILKIKRFKDGEFEILDIKPKPKGRGCLFTCRNDINGQTFDCNPMGSYDEQELWVQDKINIIGKQVTIKYYERSGVTKCPWHANVVTIRDYE